MTERMKTILNHFHHYATDHLAALCFGLSEETVYDALVAAPSFVPFRILNEAEWEIRQTGQQGYCAGWEAEKDGRTLAWIKTAAGGCNLLDYLAVCAERGHAAVGTLLTGQHVAACGLECALVEQRAVLEY